MLIAENTEMGTEIAGLQNTNRKLGADLLKAERKLNDPKESPLGRDVRTILEYWQKQTGHKRASVDLGSDRAALVRKQLKRYSPTDLMEAIDGAALLPYKRFGKRYAKGEKNEVATQLEDCVGKDKWIDENRAVLRRAVHDASLGAQWLLDAWDRANAWSSVLSQLILDATCLIERGVQPGEPLERFLWRRWQEGEQEWARIMADLDRPALTVIDGGKAA